MSFQPVNTSHSGQTILPSSKSALAPFSGSNDKNSGEKQGKEVQKQRKEDHSSD